MANFNPAIDHLLQVEGGYVNHKSDRGAATKYGITQATLDRYNDLVLCDHYNVRFLSKSTARDIYKKLYWDPMRLEAVRCDSVALVIFDQGVNQGISRVGMRVQRVLSELRRDPGPIDGIIGPLTLEALNGISPYTFKLHFLIRSLQYYAKIVRNDPTQSVFILGWINRVSNLLYQLGRR